MKNNIINIAISSDNNYAPHTAATIYSIIRNNSSNSKINFYYLCPPNFSSYNKKKIKKIISHNQNYSLNFINMENSFDNVISEIKHLTTQTYYRLLLANIVNEKKCLYFDSDVIVETDLSKLYNTNLKTNYIAAVKAAAYHQLDGNQGYCNRIGLDNIDQYINAGVILFNLYQIRKYKITNKFILLSKNNLPSDQDIINIACFNNIKHLPFKYNAMSKYFSSNPEYISNAIRIYGKKEYNKTKLKPLIIHYAGEEKPWLKKHIYKSSRFWFYLKKTGYYNKVKLNYIKKIIVSYFLIFINFFLNLKK